MSKTKFKESLRKVHHLVTNLRIKLSYFSIGEPVRLLLPVSNPFQTPLLMRKLRLIWKFTDAAEENSYFSNTDVEKATECVKFEPIDRYFQYLLIARNSHCGQILVWIMDPLCPPKSWGHAEKKPLILEQFSIEFLRGRGFESHFWLFGFSTYLLWAITDVYCNLT